MSVHTDARSRNASRTGIVHKSDCRRDINTLKKVLCSKRSTWVHRRITSNQDKGDGSYELNSLNGCHYSGQSPSSFKDLIIIRMKTSSITIITGNGCNVHVVQCGRKSCRAALEVSAHVLYSLYLDYPSHPFLNTVTP